MVVIAQVGMDRVEEVIRLIVAQPQASGGDQSHQGGDHDQDGEGTSGRHGASLLGRSGNHGPERQVTFLTQISGGGEVNPAADSSLIGQAESSAQSPENAFDERRYRDVRYLF